MYLCPPSVVMMAHKLFSKGTIVGPPSIFTDGGKRGSVAVIYYFPEGLLNLFSDSVYTANLLPWLSRCFIKPDTNPLFSSIHTGLHSPTGKSLLHLHPACQTVKSPARSYNWGKCTHWSNCLNRDIYGLHWTSRPISFMHTHKCVQILWMDFKVPDPPLQLGVVSLVYIFPTGPA
jgi:hypothetical protein